MSGVIFAVFANFGHFLRERKNNLFGSLPFKKNKIVILVFAKFLNFILQLSVRFLFEDLNNKRVIHLKLVNFKVR